MDKLDQLLDAYEETVIDLAVERVRDEGRQTLAIHERYRDNARAELVQHVEDLAGDMSP